MLLELTFLYGAHLWCAARPQAFGYSGSLCGGIQGGHGTDLRASTPPSTSTCPRPPLLPGGKLVPGAEDHHTGCAAAYLLAAASASTAVHDITLRLPALAATPLETPLPVALETALRESASIAAAREHAAAVPPGGTADSQQLFSWLPALLRQRVLPQVTAPRSARFLAHSATPGHDVLRRLMTPHPSACCCSYKLSSVVLPKFSQTACQRSQQPFPSSCPRCQAALCASNGTVQVSR